MVGMEVKPAAYMTIRERLDFAIVVLVFGVLTAALALSIDLQLSSMLISFSSSNSFGILSAQILVSQKLSLYHLSKRSAATHGLLCRSSWFYGGVLAFKWSGRCDRHCTTIRPGLYPPFGADKQGPRAFHCSGMV